MQKFSEGYCAELFETPSHHILKLAKPGWDASDLRQEYENTKAANVLGIPSPKVYEFVERDGRFGFLMEKLNGETMLRCIQMTPFRSIRFAKQLARLHHRIHSVSAAAGSFPAQREVYRSSILSRPSLNSAEKTRLMRQLENIPEDHCLSVCHGDFHPMNVLFQGDSPFVIDWAFATLGDPCADVAGTFLIIQLLAANSGGHNAFERFLFNAFTPLFAEVYLKEYLKLSGHIRHEITRWLPIRAATYLDLHLPEKTNQQLRKAARRA